MTKNRQIDVVIASLIFLFTVLVFWPVCHNEFLAWDDGDYVFAQPQVIAGINWKSIAWALTTPVAGNWHPLTMWSLQLDAQLFGHEAFGFHRTAIFLHSFNAVLLYVTLLILTNRRWESAVVAIIFAIHPLRVEPVAWVSERKELLGGCFFLLTICSYVYYMRSPSWRRYFLVMIGLALGLASKVMLVTLPCVLLLLDYWPLERFQNSARSNRSVDSLWLIVEKIPLFALSAAFSLITIVTQEEAMRKWPLAMRLQYGLISYGTYLRQTIWPLGLTGFYGPYEIPIVTLLFAASVLLLITLIVLWQRNRRPYLIVGWLWFLGMLFPVSGVVQVGKQVHADRYMYLPQIGLLIAIVWLASDFARDVRWRRIALGGITAGFVTVCIVITEQLIPTWHDTEAMFGHAIRAGTGGMYMSRSLMLMYFADGKKDKAVELLPEVLNFPHLLESSDVRTFVLLASYLADAGKHRESLQVYDRITEQIPQNVEVISNRGKVKAAAGDWSGAANDFRQAMELDPKSDSYPFYLAHALQKAGQTDAAITAVRAAIRKAPNWPHSAANIANNSLQQSDGMTFWSLCLAEQANLATDGRDSEILNVLAKIYARTGNYRDAVNTVQKAIEFSGGSRDKKHAVQLQKLLETWQKQLAEQPEQKNGEQPHE